MVTIHRAHFGRGPRATRTIVADDIVVCVMSDVFTNVEKTLIQAGGRERVREARILQHRALAEQVCEPVERLTGRGIAAFASSVHFDPDMAIETFVLEPSESG
jgi:uncharacterized protein YbcI